MRSRRTYDSPDLGARGDRQTLHAMQIFFHTSRGATLANNSGADGIGAALHFIRNGTVLGAKNACATCSDYKFIQVKVMKSNEPADPRGDDFVDNASSASPFYDDVYLGGGGVHAIPTNYPDAGDKVDTTRSIYDRPYRSAARLGLVTGKNFHWNAEACITCRRPTKD